MNKMQIYVFSHTNYNHFISLIAFEYLTVLHTFVTLRLYAVDLILVAYTLFSVLYVIK